MPTVLRYRGYRFFFYSNEHKPKHIHVEKAEKVAKFTINPVELVQSKKFNSMEIRIIRVIIEQRQNLFNQAWNEYFNN